MFNSRADAGEEQPLIQSVTPSSMGSACFLAVTGALVCTWCVLDSWQRSVSAQLFDVSQITGGSVDKLTGEATLDVTHAFTYPLTLAFFQFAFMATIFLAIWWVTSRSPTADIARIRQNSSVSQWGGLVATHIFSTFWLQSLMMPLQMMSPAFFAATRAVQVPAAAAFRSKITSGRFGGHPVATTAMMFGAATLLIYSQAMISECLCIWSGHGVQLAGIALVLIYFLVLILPAANAVFMESMMGNRETNPLLMLASMNILACLCCMPLLGFAHMAGWENVRMAFAVTMANRELYMLVLWLGVQMVLLSAVTLALIAMMDSFWSVALTTSFKAVFWWCSSIMNMYLSCPLTNVSIQHPHASFWGFVMLLGCVLVGCAAKVDASAAKEPFVEAKRATEKV